MIINNNNLRPTVDPTWCAGCGNFSLKLALDKAIKNMKIKPYNVAMTFDIGCSGNGANYYDFYSFHALHGRSLPVALGIKMANPKLTVVASAGDGGGYGEGGNHFMHACRSNVNVSFIVHNNQRFALTKGQTSPTSEEGFVSPSTPFGHEDRPLNALQVAIVSGATFVARGYAGKVNHLAEIISQAIKHDGFSLVEILQPCTSLNKINTFAWYNKRVYELSKWSGSDRLKAIEKAGEWGNRIPVGVLYQKKATQNKKQSHFDFIGGVKKRNIQNLIEEFE